MKKKILLSLSIIMFFNICNSFLIPPLDTQKSLELVKISSQILPNFDTVGHYVLNLNEHLITQVINSHLNYDLKKTLILKIIELTRQGDEMGGIILQNYYNFVNNIL